MLAHTCADSFNVPRYDFHALHDKKVSKMMPYKALRYQFSGDTVHYMNHLYTMNRSGVKK